MLEPGHSSRPLHQCSQVLLRYVSILQYIHSSLIKVVHEENTAKEVWGFHFVHFVHFYILFPTSEDLKISLFLFVAISGSCFVVYCVCVRLWLFGALVCGHVTFAIFSLDIRTIFWSFWCFRKTPLALFHFQDVGLAVWFQTGKKTKTWGSVDVDHPRSRPYWVRHSVPWPDSSCSSHVTKTT